MVFLPFINIKTNSRRRINKYTDIRPPWRMVMPYLKWAVVVPVFIMQDVDFLTIFLSNLQNFFQS